LSAELAWALEKYYLNLKKLVAAEEYMLALD
jgi:hypothetical protein